ncbi:GTP pyrophosphokinase family protein, partial [Bacillus spizizenii]|nr:GTP pyrophosphokinase family protein [Bacillus spizizenii]
KEAAEIAHYLDEKMLGIKKDVD